MSIVLHEQRSAARAILARPGFSALVVGVLGAGLACVVFMLALLDGCVLRPLPFPDPATLYQAGIAAGGWPVVATTLAVLAAAALFAVIVPARRALRVDPIAALRHE